jgi:hypothetical protein
MKRSGINYLVILLAGCLLLACTNSNAFRENGGAADDQLHRLSDQDSIIEQKMLHFYLDPRLENRDTSRLGDGIWLKVQIINMGKSPILNLKYKVGKNGDVWLVRHSGDRNATYEIPLDRDWAAEPNEKLESDKLEQAMEKLRESDFFNQPGYQKVDGIEGGTAVVIQAILEGTAHEVIYIGGNNAPMPYFLELFH